MSAFRELGYGVMLFASALAGLSVAVLSQRSLDWRWGEDKIFRPAIGAVIGGIAWLIYKYAVLEKPRN